MDSDALSIYEPIWDFTSYCVISVPWFKIEPRTSVEADICFSITKQMLHFKRFYYSGKDKYIVFPFVKNQFEMRIKLGIQCLYHPKFSEYYAERNGIIKLLLHSILYAMIALK